MSAPPAVWLWVTDAVPDDALIGFLSARGVSEVFLSVGWAGATPATRGVVAALRARGIGASCLGGAPDWADQPDRAVQWSARALATGLFDRVHLDIEPWTRRDWPARADTLLDGCAAAVRSVAAATSKPVEVDLPGWLARTHPARCGQIVAAAAAITVMAYRDRAPDILAEARELSRLAAQRARAFRVGVDTRPATDFRATFHDDGSAALRRETRAVSTALRTDARFAGIAVHDAAGWRALRP